MSVSLWTTPYAAAAIESVFVLWLRAAAKVAWRGRCPTAVIVPFQSDAYLLKTHVLAAGLDLLGVRFFTPSALREQLTRHFGLAARFGPQEHLRLLLATAVERSARDGPASAVASDHLLKAIDLLSAGGWSFHEAGPRDLRPVVAEFERLVKRGGLVLVHDADRELLARAQQAPPLFARLCVFGFNSRHWPLWPLLAAAVHAADEVTLCLTEPRSEAEELDATWIGTWEEAFGPTQPAAPDETARPFVEVLRLPASKDETAARRAAPSAKIEFLVGQNTAEQTQAIVTMALRFLAEPACERLGILFPGAGGLARRTAALLAERGVPHNDGLAQRAPGPFEDSAWPAWIELQENPRLPALLAYLRVHSAAERFFGGLPFAKVERELTRTFGDLLIDDLGVIAEYLAQHSPVREAAALAEGLRAFPMLPEKASLDEFCTVTVLIFRALDWGERAEELARLAKTWQSLADLSVARRAWLRWLRGALVSWRVVRAEIGSHPYSRVQLLPYTQAETQPWTHLIVAGLNEGHWPPPLEEMGYLGEEGIDTLNRRVRVLNLRALMQGSQGEGHSTVQSGKALCLGPAQHRALVLRQFLNTLESTNVAIAASAQLFDEAAAERRLNPGDFFTRLHFCARGRALSQETMTALREETRHWLDASGLWQTAPANLADVQQTGVAFAARHDAAKPFGEYEFGLRTPLDPPMRLTATDWERARTAPSIIWMKHRLGVEPRDHGDETPWSLAIGQWVHRWLGAISGTAEPQNFVPLPQSREALAIVRAQASAFRERILHILRARGRSAPDWWLSTWKQALELAERLAQRATAAPDRTHLATEWTMEDIGVSLDAGEPLHVRGRIDLILTTTPPVATALPHDAWIVDYKTGGRKPLDAGRGEREVAIAKRLRTSDGLQLALYALAFINSERTPSA